MELQNGPRPYFIDASGKSQQVTKENWKFKGSPFHALIEWNFSGCRKTLMLPQRKHPEGYFLHEHSNGINFYGPNEKLIHIRCDAIYKGGYLLYNSLDDIISDLELIGEHDLVLEVKDVQGDLADGVYDDQLRKMSDDYQKEKIECQGPAGPDPRWISVGDEKPTYNKAVIIFDGEKTHYEWRRMGDEDGEFYGSLNTDRIIENATHWMPLPEPPRK